MLYQYNNNPNPKLAPIFLRYLRKMLKDTPIMQITKNRSHTQLHSRKQVIAFQDRVITKQTVN